MSATPATRIFALAAVVVALAGPAHASLYSSDRLDLFADFRVRLERDFDSRRGDGTERDDRTRLRVRARTGLEFRAGEFVSFGLRLRSGSDLNHQSSNITLIDFDDNDTGDADFNFDRWYVEARGGPVSGWIGRNSFPFWKQNELFWDDDATVAGLAGRMDRKIGRNAELSLRAAYLTLPVGMREFAGGLVAGQVVYVHSFDELRFTIAGGLFRYEPSDAADDPDAAVLRNGNGARDYRIFILNTQFRFSAGGRPLQLGADYMRNDESYSAADPDPFTRANRGETEGIVASVRYGELDDRADWQVAYSYGRIEALAVIASYAQDDWMRWGSSTETDSSDLEGHEFRFAYGLTKKMNLLARLYLVDAITSIQDGSRLRVDLNYKF